MKTAIPLQQYKKCIILFMIGTVCSALAYAFYVINPLRMILDYKVQMAPGSLLFTMWKKPPIDVYLKVYVFNITNPTEFLNGEQKLKVEELGPYVYQEVLENHNVTWNDNGTISYMPKRTVLYVPEMSTGDPETDLVYVPNIPMLGVSSALSDAGFFVNFPLTQLANALSKPILNISVYEYLWGYDDTLVTIASGVVPGFINFRKFGLLDRMYDEGENTLIMNIRKNENMTDEKGRYLSIETYNGSPGLSHWGYRPEEGNETHSENSICNRIQGTTEAAVFPSDLDKRAIFRVFRKAFCRPIPIVFKEEVTHAGIPGYVYTLADNFLDPPDQNPDNECYCRKLKRCLKKGLSDLTPCYYNIPAAISLPHFLNADPSLLEDVEGLRPDAAKHGSKIVLQPTIGIPIFVNSRLQTNLVMQHTSYNSKIAAFNDITIPLFWTDLSIPSLPSDIALLTWLMTVILPVAQSVMIYLLATVGAAMILMSLVATLWVFSQQQQLLQQQQHQQQRQQQEHTLGRRDSTDLRIPLGYGQYTAIRILPAIKKITSKTELFS